MIILLLSLVTGMPHQPEVVVPPPHTVAPRFEERAAEPPAESVALAMQLFPRQAMRDHALAGVLVLMDGVLEQARARFASSGLPSAEFDTMVTHIRNGMMSEFMDVFEAEAENMRRLSARVYANRFSAAELRELIEINSRPVMQKAQQITPVMMLEISRQSDALFAPYLPRIQQRSMELVQEYERQHRRPQTH